MANLQKSFKYAVPLSLPNFQAHAVSQPIRQWSFLDVTAVDWYAEFQLRIRNAIGKTYLPIYRMADGEFIFCVGERLYLPAQAKLNSAIVWRMCRGALRKVRNAFSEDALSTCWGEQYGTNERARLMPEYVQHMRRISAKGLLAIHFVEMESQVFGKEYFGTMCDWFDSQGIPLNEKNYAPFHFVYALLAEAHLNGFFAGLRVAVITHLSEIRTEKISNALLALGAAKVDFLSISSSKAMTDHVHGLDHCDGFDLALVGAGVGSANILCQLEKFSTVCIDAGFFLETLIDPSRRGERMFTRTDNESMPGRVFLLQVS
jgi:hypothetical protein